MEESRRDGIETIEAIRRIKTELPGVHTVVGLSNVSFGLSPAARQVLNSVFPARMRASRPRCPRSCTPARSSPCTRSRSWTATSAWISSTTGAREGYDPLSALIDAFEGESAATHSAIEDRSDWTVERRLERRIVDGDRDGLEAELDEALGAGHAALDIVNDMLLAGMRTVGELFGSGQMQLRSCSARPRQ